MKHLRKFLLAAMMAGFALPVNAEEDLDKLVPDAAEIFGRFKREDLINMDLVKDAKRHRDPQLYWFRHRHRGNRGGRHSVRPQG